MPERPHAVYRIDPVGGARRNRLFMAASHSLYALYVNTTRGEVMPAWIEDVPRFAKSWSRIALKIKYLRKDSNRLT